MLGQFLELALVLLGQGIDLLLVLLMVRFDEEFDLVFHLQDLLLEQLVFLLIGLPFSSQLLLCFF